MKIKKTLEKIALYGTLIASLTFSKCEKEPFEVEHEPTILSGISTTQIAGGLERPSGLSSNYLYSNHNKSGSIKSIQESDLSVLAQAPLFAYSENRIDFANSVNPKISQISGDLDNLSLNSEPLTEFNLEDYFVDFNTPMSLGYPLAKPVGLVLDNLVLDDGSILVSSNSSDKIFKISLSGIEVYLQDEQLKRITDIIKGTDGKDYAIQAPYVEDSILYIPKKVISIDSKIINTEFELPSENSLRYDYLASYWEQLKIIENSKLGKEKFGTEFYVSDLLEKVIYKVDAQRNVSELARGLRFPSSLAVDSIGDIFYTTSPLWRVENGQVKIKYPTTLCMLNPATKESTTLYTFSQENGEEWTEGGINLDVEYNGGKYELPVGFNISNILYESADKMDFLFTNSHQGTLIKLSADKY